MDITTALALVNEICYKPSWKFSAEGSDRFGSTIVVRAEWDNPNFNRENAPDFQEMARPTAGFLVIIDDIETPRPVLPAHLRRGDHGLREPRGSRGLPGRERVPGSVPPAHPRVDGPLGRRQGRSPVRPRLMAHPAIRLTRAAQNLLRGAGLEDMEMTDQERKVLVREINTVISLSEGLLRKAGTDQGD